MYTHTPYVISWVYTLDLLWALWSHPKDAASLQSHEPSVVRQDGSLLPGRVIRPHNSILLFMIETPQDLMYPNCKDYGIRYSILCLGDVENLLSAVGL